MTTLTNSGILKNSSFEKYNLFEGGSAVFSSPNTSGVPKGRGVMDTTGSIDKVIHQIFFDEVIIATFYIQLYGFWQRDFPQSE